MRRRAHFDAVIVGGGVIGSATAYHLSTPDSGLRVAVVERDPTYRQASSALSVGNVRVQFGLRQNVQISQYALQFLGRVSQTAASDDRMRDLGFRREGNLFLVDEAERSRRRAAWSLQTDLGCEVEWWSTATVEQRYPLYRAAGYAGATFGPGEGHLDGYSLLMAFREQAIRAGARFLTAEAERISTSSRRVTGVELGSGVELLAPVVVNCAGAWAAPLAATAGVELPVIPVQRQVFVAEPAVKPERPLPLTGLPSGLYFRSEGPDRILVGKSLADDGVGFDLRWQRRRFTEVLWPELVRFVPAFDRLRLERGWAGLYAVNTLDGNAILGEWPSLAGLYLANGFSGHGLQQAPAVGRYLAERITGRLPALDLSALGPERIVAGKPLFEPALV